MSDWIDECSARANANPHNERVAERMEDGS
jgi:hypothetical protein